MQQVCFVLLRLSINLRFQDEPNNSSASQAPRTLLLGLPLSVPTLPVLQQSLAPAVNNHGWGPRRRASAANELLGLVRRAVETKVLRLPLGKTHTHHKRLFAYTCTRTPSPSHPISSAHVRYLALQEVPQQKLFKDRCSFC